MKHLLSHFYFTGQLRSCTRGLVNGDHTVVELLIPGACTPISVAGEATVPGHMAAEGTVAGMTPTAFHRVWGHCLAWEWSHCPRYHPLLDSTARDTDCGPTILQAAHG